MPSRSPLRYAFFLAAALVALGVAALVALFALARVPEEVHLTYEDYLKEARAATFPRPDNPPGWTLEDGAAADAYWDAYRKLDAAKTDKDPLDQLERFALLIAQDRIRSGAPPRRLAAPPPECVALGVPDTPSALGDVLTPAICAHLASAPVQDALALLNQGCRRRDARGPGHLDDPMAYDGDRQRLQVPFIKLSKLNLIQAHIDAAQGKHRDGLSRVLCNVRFGLDLTHSHSLINTMIGAAVHAQSLGGLRALFADYPDLGRDADLIAHAAANLAWYRPSADLGERALKGEYLYVMSIGEVGPKDDAQLPQHLRVARQQLGTSLRDEGGVFGGAMIRHALGDLHTHYTGLIQAASAPPAQRRAIVKALTDQVGASLNPLSNLAVPNLSAYLTKVDLITDDHNRTIATLADLHHQATHNAKATQADALDLLKALPEPLACPFSGAPYALTQTDACRALDCAPIDADLLEDLNAATGEFNTYAAQTCLIDAPAPAPAPDDAPTPDAAPDAPAQDDAP